MDVEHFFRGIRFVFHRAPLGAVFKILGVIHLIRGRFDIMLNHKIKTRISLQIFHDLEDLQGCWIELSQTRLNWP
jgi:hypothetical protein